MHVNWNRLQFLMIFIEFWCLTLSSLFKHNVNGHEFNTSTENTVTQDVTLKNEGICVFVCVCMCTLSPCWFVHLIWFPFFFLIRNIRLLFKMISDHTFNRNQAVLLLLLFQPLERKKKIAWWNQAKCWNFDSCGSYINWHYKCDGEEGSLD